jgi:hypothetical protein
MLLGGLWHGAAWNFVLWGAYQGLILILYRLFDQEPEHLKPWSGKYPIYRVLGKMLLMFILANIGWVIFRSTSIAQINYLLTNCGISLSQNSLNLLQDLLFFSAPLFVVQLWQYVTRDLLIVPKVSSWILIPLYSLFLILISLYGVRTSTEFIYFQF